MKISDNAPLKRPAEIELDENFSAVPRKIVAVARDYPDGFSTPPHEHVISQLEYASEGLLTVKTSYGVWIVPPQHAVWVPAHTKHWTYSPGHLSIRTVFVNHASIQIPHECCVVTVQPLLKELILHAVTLPHEYTLGGSEERIMDVILDMLKTLKTAPLHLPIGDDERLRKIYDAFSQDPTDNRTLVQWGRFVGATDRTLSRLFRTQTGMSFQHWRQQFRVLKAMEYLGQGVSVTDISYDLGYNSVSAFISMFKKTLGTTPGQYFL